MYSIDITAEQIAIYEIGAICIVVALIAILLRVLPIARCRRRCDEISDQDLSDIKYEDTSIIVYSNDECSDLEILLPQLLEQDYPARFEVIVVNEGDSPRVREAVGLLQINHTNLYLTHTPDGARNLSRKKLAITLGVKAARYPVAVLTSASGRIGSTLWLRRIMQHFNSDSSTEVVFGYAVSDHNEDTGIGRRARSFDNCVRSATWIGNAISGHPWRGTEYNLAYRRELFFNNKGFSKHLNLRDGDDDIFISEIATKDNTAIELSAESIVTIASGCSASAMRQEQARRRFTERFIRRPRILDIVITWTYVIGFIAAIAAAILQPFSKWSWIFSGTTLLIWYATGLTWRIGVKSLNGRPLLLTLPLLALTRPLRQIARTIYAITHRSKRYSWQ